MKYMLYKINRFIQNFTVRVAFIAAKDTDFATIAVEVEPESIIESTPESVSNLLLLACKFVARPAALNISNTL